MDASDMRGKSQDMQKEEKGREDAAWVPWGSAQGWG